MKKHIHHFQLLHLIILVGLIILIAIQVHWAVALVLAWIAYTISSIAGTFRKIQDTVNSKLENQKKDLNSIIKQASEDIVNKLESRDKSVNRFLRTEPPMPRSDRPGCSECLSEPKPGAIIYNQGNCPIHD